MPGQYIDEIGDVYASTVIPKTNKQDGSIMDLRESETVGATPADSFPAGEDTIPADLDKSGPGAAEGFVDNEHDPNLKNDKESAYDEQLHSQPVKRTKKAVKKESKQINNSTMKESTNKSTFDRLFEDVMGDELDIDLGGDEGLGDEMGDEGLGDELGGDVVSVELPRDVAEQLHGALGEMLGGGEEEEITDIEDTEDEFGGDELEMPESHVELNAVPDSVGAMTGMNNKVSGSGHVPGGGSASSDAAGQEDGGKPKSQPEGFTHAKTKNNKVGGAVSGGNKDFFKA